MVRPPRAGPARRAPNQESHGPPEEEQRGRERRGGEGAPARPDRPERPHGDRRRDAQAVVPRSPAVRPGEGRAHRHLPRPILRRRLCRARPDDASLDPDAAGVLPERREAGLLPLPRVPDGPGAREQPAEPRDARPDALGAQGPRPRSRRSPRAGAGRGARATAASAGWPPASSTRSRRCSTPPTATASATSSGSSTRRSATATRSSGPRSGSASGTPGRSPAPSTWCRSPSTAGPSTGWTPRAGSASRWVDARHVLGMPYDVPIAGFRQRHREHPPALAGPRVAGARPRGLQRRRLPRRGGGQGPLGEHLEGPLPERPHRDGQGAAAAAAVLLRRLLDPRHRRAPPQDPRGVRRLPGQGRDPAQRHPPRHRDRRAHARAGGRARDRVGPRLGALPGDLRLHEPHAHARGPGEVVRRPLRAGAAAPPRDRLRGEPPVPRRGAREAPGGRGGGLADEPHRGGAGEAGPDGEPRGGGVAVRERGRRAPHRAPQARAVPGLPRHLAGPVQQQDQRRDPAPLAPAVEPRPRERPHRGDRAGVDHRRDAAARPRAPRGGRRVPAALPRHQAREQGAARRDREGGERPHPRRGLDLRRAGEADPRVQAPAPRHPAHRGGVPAHEGGPDLPAPPALVPVRREGGPGLRDGEGDHQAHLLGRRRREPRRGPARGASPSRSSRTTGSRSPSGSSPPPTCPSRSPPPGRRRPARGT